MYASNKKVLEYIVHMLRKLEVEIKGSHLWCDVPMFASL